MRKAADGRSLVPIHLQRFERECRAFERVRLVRRLPAPQDRLDVVLKKNRWNRERLRKVQRRGEKVADGDIEPLLAVPLADEPADVRRRELGHGVRRRRQHVPGIMERDGGSAFRRSRCERHRTGKLLLRLALVPRVAFSTVIRKKRDVVPLGKMTKQVVRTNLSARIDRQQFAGFYPKNSHGATYTSASEVPRSSGRNEHC